VAERSQSQGVFYFGHSACAMRRAFRYIFLFVNINNKKDAAAITNATQIQKG